jgi:ribosomal protein S1
VVKVAQKVQVRVTEVDEARKRIALSMKSQWWPADLTVLKFKAQRIKYKDGIAIGDEFVNYFKNQKK